MSSAPLLRQRSLSILAIADLVAKQTRLGWRADELLQGTGIQAADLNNPDALITPLQEQMFFSHWLQKDGRPHCGLEVGAHYRLMHFGHLGLIVPHAATRRDAIDLFLRFINLSYTHFTPSVDILTGILTLRGGEHLGPLRRFYLDRDVAFTVGLVKEFFKDGAVPLKSIAFDYPLPPDQALIYEKWLGVPVRFGAELAQVQVDPSRLDEAMPEANALIVRMLQPQCEAREAQVVAKHQVRWADRVRDVLQRHAGVGPWPEAADVALKLKCSERTLRRQLSTEAEPFQNLSDEIRSQRALQLLKQTEDGLDAIAQKLGYSEAAAFIRAYKRWFGHPPGQDRN